MRNATLLAAVLGLLGMSAFAIGQPTTNPSASAQPLVLVASFQQLGDASTRAWVAQAIQEDLLATVARSGSQAKSVDKPIGGSDTAAAIQVGRDEGATLVVSGSYQVNGDQLRVNGQTTNVASGQVVQSMQATGQIRDLFSIEDSLANQLRAVLPNGSALPIVTNGSGGTPYAYLNMTPSAGNTSPNGTYSMFGPTAAPSSDNGDQSDYGPQYAPNYYGYGYGYGYGYPFYPSFGSIIIIHNHNHRHDDHFHIWNHGTGGSRPFGTSANGGFFNGGGHVGLNFSSGGGSMGGRGR